MKCANETCVCVCSRYYVRVGKFEAAAVILTKLAERKADDVTLELVRACPMLLCLCYRRQTRVMSLSSRIIATANQRSRTCERLFRSSTV